MTHVEIIPLTTDIGGFEPPTLHERLSQEVVRAWAVFKARFAQRDFSGLNEEVIDQLRQNHAGALNDGFFAWQKTAFEDGEHEGTTTWPELNSLPEYQRLRQIVAAVARRYLERSGLARAAAQSLNFSIFNWAAVHSAGEFHGPHTHVGEYQVAVFYAQVGDGAGKIRFSDPRGHSVPFGNSFIHTPRSGELILFPSWLSHMATVTAPSVHGSEGDLRVVISLNIGPKSGPLPCHMWHTDPASDMRFSRRASFDPTELDT